MNMRNGNQWNDEREMVNSGGQLEFKSNSAFMQIHHSFGKTVFGSEDDRSWSYVVNLHYPLLRVAAYYYAFTKLPRPVDIPGNYMPALTEVIESNAFRDKFRYTHGDYVFAMQSGYSEQPNASYPYKVQQPRSNWWAEDGTFEQGLVTMFIQLAEHYGWDLMTYLFTRARELEFENEYAQDALDYIVMATCEFTNENMIPFFQWYHYPMTIWATDFAKQFPTMPGSFQYTKEPPYWFITNAFPEDPDIPMTTGLVPNKKEWPAKPYYRTLDKTPPTDSDSSRNLGWLVTSTFTYPRTVNGERNKDSAQVENLHRLVDYDYTTTSAWKNIRYTASDVEKTIRTPQVTVHFLNEHQNEPMTFNAFELTVGGDAWSFGWISFIYDMEVFIPNDVNGSIKEEDGTWYPVSENRPDEPDNLDWYNGVVWTVPIRIFDTGGRTAANTYFFDETYEGVTKFRFKMVPGLGNRPGGNNNDGDWNIRLLELDFGLVSTDYPAPPKPGDSDYVPRYEYFGRMNDRTSNWKEDYNLLYDSDPAPPGFKGWLHTGHRPNNWQ
jgi:hypothetical protein